MGAWLFVHREMLPRIPSHRVKLFDVGIDGPSVLFYLKWRLNLLIEQWSKDLHHEGSGTPSVRIPAPD